ncbi:hypothetical protein GQ53DRAFT_36567 [Thozetella sp. PMI_491]|nr:hypothetical protein GQ53DRAFT_36567 [Thozetella sp. PMI_491]
MFERVRDGPMPGIAAPAPPLRKACDACHASKVRCALDPFPADGPCRRCAKNGGICTFTFLGARKKPTQTKKQRIAKLEQRVRDLLRENGVDSPEWLAHSSASANRVDDPASPIAPTPSSCSALVETTPTNPASQAAGDVVEQGILTLEEANELVHEFRMGIEGRSFGAWLPVNLTCSQLRESRPILWLGILCASAASLGRKSNLSKSLSSEMDKLLQIKLDPEATPSIEVLLVTHIYILHHYEPTYNRLQLIMGYMDLATMMVTKLARSIAHNPPTSDDLARDIARELLVWHWANGLVEMKTGKPSKLTYDDALVQRALERMESSQDRVDQSLVAWVTLPRITSDTSMQFDNGPDGSRDVAVWQLERKLEQWIRNRPPEIMNEDLLLEYHYNFILIHEIYPYSRKSRDKSAASRKLPSLDESSPQTDGDINMPWKEITPGCVSAAQEILNIFIEMDPKRVRCMPIVTFGRVFYALRLLFHAAYRILRGIPSTVSLSDLKTETYIEALQRALLLAADGSGSNAAATWLYALRSRLLPWYTELRKRSNLGAPHGVTDKSVPRFEAGSTGRWANIGGYRHADILGTNQGQSNLASQTTGAAPNSEFLESFNIWQVDPEDVIEMYMYRDI